MMCILFYSIYILQYLYFTVFIFYSIYILQYLYFTVFIFYSIYILGLVLQWVKDEGGVDKMEENSRLKSQAVYDAIEKSNGFYQYVQYNC